MNIDKIIKECPRAWEKCLLFFGYGEDDDRQLWTIYDIEKVSLTENGSSIMLEISYCSDECIGIRDLYDFFDSVEIKIEVSDKSYESYWVYDVDDYNDNKEYFYEGFDSRTEAEYRAFEKAFEIYEKQLEEVNNE